jgi:septum formation protein
MDLTPRLVLASASPRRRDLLGQLGVPFEVHVADVDETPLPGEVADDLARRLACAKAETVLARLDVLSDGVVVLAADTVVAVGDEVLGKPVDAADAARMLGLLSGTRHQVHTGVAVAASWGTAARLEVAVEVTHVHMGPWTDEEILGYIATGEPFDKAGSYAIQEVGDRFVTAIEGTFDNVVGLPLGLTRRMLADAGLPVAEAAAPAGAGAAGAAGEGLSTGGETPTGPSADRQIAQQPDQPPEV